MKIVINNVIFDYNIGCRLLKAKHKDQPFKGLEDFWEDIVPITFKEIATEIKNLEQRRVAIGCLGINEVVNEVKAVLVGSETLDKQTSWVTPEGDVIQHSFKDTYELYKVDGSNWKNGVENNWNTSSDDVYYVRCKDTSTDREYLIWVDAMGIARTNNTERWFSSEMIKNIKPIQAIAWTFQTNVPAGAIDKIVRQGDCIMIKRKAGASLLDTPRHLTEIEYRELLVAES
jgi:nicotinamide mononucleotide adenylyltransferase